MTWQQSLFPPSAPSTSNTATVASPMAPPRAPHPNPRRRNSYSTSPSAPSSISAEQRKTQQDPFSSSATVMSTPIKARQDAAAAAIRGETVGGLPSSVTRGAAAGGGAVTPGGPAGMGGVRYAGPTFHNSPMAEAIPKPRFGGK
jgi:hypothetical protein